MCPVVLFALISSFILLLLEVSAALSVTFWPARVNQLKEDQLISVSFKVNNTLTQLNQNLYPKYEYYIDDTSVVDIVGDKTFVFDPNGHRNQSFELKGKFLGHSWLQLVDKDSGERSERLDISVVRPMSQITKIFTISVAVLVSINYINMGCALDTHVVLNVLRRPIAPTIGFVCQYAFMPLVCPLQLIH